MTATIPEVRLAGVTLDPFVVLTPLKLTVGRSDPSEQPEANAADVTILGVTSAKRGDTLEVDHDGVRRFTGKVTDLKTTLVDGRLATQITGMGRKAELGGVMVGDTPWPVQTEAQRVAAIVAAMPAGSPTIQVDGSSLKIRARDVDRQPVLDLLHEIAESTGALVWEDTSGVIHHDQATAREGDRPEATVTEWQILDGVEWAKPAGSVIGTVEVEYGPEVSDYVSSDVGNVAVSGTDGKVYVPPGSGGGGTVPTPTLMVTQEEWGSFSVPAGQNAFTPIPGRGVTFVAPPSGAVLVQASAAVLRAYQQGMAVSFNVHEGPSIGAGATLFTGSFPDSIHYDGQVATPSLGGISGASKAKLITGLTPGDTYNAILTARNADTVALAFDGCSITILPVNNGQGSKGDPGVVIGDYVEGTYTPTFTRADGTTAVAVTGATGWYQQQGKVVRFGGSATITAAQADLALVLPITAGGNLSVIPALITTTSFTPTGAGENYMLAFRTYPGEKRAVFMAGSGGWRGVNAGAIVRWTGTYEALNAASPPGGAGLDTGWVDITTRAGFANQGSSVPQVRKIGNVVHTRWGWSSTGIAANTTYIIADIPAGFRPVQTVYCRAGTPSGAVEAQLVVATNGSIELRTGATLGNYYLLPNVTWLTD